MAQNKVALKRRIRSVRATKKITNAMELIATSKLQRQKQKMQKEVLGMEHNLLLVLILPFLKDCIWEQSLIIVQPGLHLLIK